MKRLLRWLLRGLFGFRAYNEAVLQTAGPLLLIPNHVSFVDWLFLYVCCQEDWRCVVSRTGARVSWLHRKIMINRRTFPVDTDSPYAVKRMHEHLQQGNRLALFAEGRLSRSGSLGKLFEGTGFLLYKTGARVIVAHLRGAQRLPWSPNPGWKRLFPRITLHFSEVLVPPEFGELSTTQARTQLTDWLLMQMQKQQFEVEMAFGPPTVPAAIVAAARQRPQTQVVEDIMRQPLSYRRLLAGGRVLAAKWEVWWSEPGERVGVLLPNTNAFPVTLLSLWQSGAVPAILNYSSGSATMLACAQLAGLKHIITSRRFIARAKIAAQVFEEAGIQLIYLEDVRKTVGRADQLRGLWQALQSPRAWEPEATAVILFTSGSEGTPKGVELSHRNLLANIRQMVTVMDLLDSDRLFNALPLFHSFGLTVGTLLPLVRGIYVFLFPSPLQYRVVASAFYNLDCTVFFSTNTFLNGYARKAHPYDFSRLRYLFAGAEKLQRATADFWAQRFGVRIFEGYGATECGPVLSANTKLAPKFGSAGRFLPGVEYRIEAVEGVAEGGRLFVRGPNIMRGYVNRDANEKFQSLGGWYDTGDIVRVDEEGFVHILGRLKRFAKVSGEMVSLTAVEDAVAGAFPHYGLRCQVAIISQPDEEKGETLVAVTNEPKLRLDEVRAVLKAKGMTNLSVPREIRPVREIPLLGTGKINHRELMKLVATVEGAKG